MIASNVLAFFALIASTKNFEVSGQDCSSPEALRPCVSKMIQEVMNPDFLSFSESLRQMRSDPGRPVNITEPHLKVVCRFGKNVLPCIVGYVERCSSQAAKKNMPGTVGLLRVCDQPDVYSKTQTLLTCYNSSPRFQSCFGNLMATQQAQQSSFAANLTGALQMWQSDAGFQNLLVDYCCRIRKFQECATSDIKERCTPEGAKMEADAYDAIFTANACQNQICPGDSQLKTTFGSTGNSVRSAIHFLFIGSVLALVPKLLI